LQTESKFIYPKAEKLKSQKAIDLLFSEGKSVSKYPLRLVYRKMETHQEETLKFGVSVSKKYFKHAVDRNYYKRILRETYRLNKHIFVDKLSDKYAIMFFYQTKDRLDYQEINTKTIQIFEKLLIAIQEEK
jgi:ribonuclease P protein component